MQTHWIYLLIAGILETVWAVGLKYSHGFTRLWPSIITIVGMLVGFYFLSLALKHLPLGTAYAIWTGLGILGTFLVGVLLFHESASWGRLLCAAMICGGIVGLKLLSPE